MLRPLVQANKLLIAIHMRRHGFSRAQTERLIGRLGDGKIWEIIKKYGPILFMIFVKYILPLLLALEQPEEQPKMGDYFDEMVVLTAGQEELLGDASDVPLAGSIGT